MMELQLAQNDPRGQDWCKVNLLVTDKPHSGTSFSLYHLIMTLLCSGQAEHEERDFLPSMVMLLLARLVAHLARCELRRFVCLLPSCDSTVLSARASSAFLRARLGLSPFLLTTFCHPPAAIVHPITIRGVRQHRTCEEVRVPSHAARMH